MPVLDVALLVGQSSPLSVVTHTALSSRFGASAVPGNWACKENMQNKERMWSIVIRFMLQRYETFVIHNP